MEADLRTEVSEQPTSQTATVTESRREPLYLVGIGASAGGLEALERFFEKMPRESGLAFVVVQHLSPDFKSLTDELLARRTRIPIFSVQDGADVHADAIYLLPPRKDMIISGGKLLLTDKDPSLLSLPIDHFFRSLAQDAGQHAIGIILSGTGSDGSRGIRDIHDAGGLVIAQSPDSAKFDGMPRSALKSGTVHFTLAPEEMPDALLRYVNHPQAKDAPLLDAPAVPESAMEAVFRLLRDAYDIDFSSYKPETVVRRTERRLQMNRSPNLDDYVRRLEEDPAELNKLYKDLLIGVTRFFRDREAFERLGENVLRPLIERLPEKDELRLWVAGCATGEEAYSLAILVHEQFEKLGRPVHAKIFATDVHRASLDIASAGLYSAADLVDVSPERLERHFVRKDDLYQVGPDLRRLVVFAHHNVIKDAPFTRLDLISCRNLLIYFQAQAQQKVLTLFHFGLKAGGILQLGPSESPGELNDEFDILDTRWKVYRKRRDVRLLNEVRLPTTAAPVRGPVGVMPAATPPAGFDGHLIGAYDALLDEFMPPSLLVGERRELLHAFGGAGRFLRQRDGRFSADVLDMVNPDLRVALNGALQRVFKEAKQVVYRGIRVALADGEQLVNLTVQPVRNQRSGVVQALVRLEEMNTRPAPAVPSEDVSLSTASADHLLSLESELRYTRENLQATIEELETSNEELQATNEELVAANEELQSTNEELHSVNEELYTVNGEYQKKIAELTELTADMDNLLTSTQVHTIFLDAALRIRKFTPSIAETFNLLPKDIGRRIDSFTHTIDHPTLLEDIQSVLRTDEPCERQVRDRKGDWFLMRILPYRASAEVEGVVLTLIDITSLKQAEETARTKDRYLTSILRNSPNFIFIKDLQRRYILADDSYRRVLGCDLIGKTAEEVYPPAIAEQITEQDRRALALGVSVESELAIPLGDGTHIYLCVRFPLRDDSGKAIGLSGIMTDVTALKRAEQQAQEAVAQRDQFLAMLSHELRNPLAAILNTAMVHEAQGLEGPEADGFRLIERRARHMARLLDDLLDVSRFTRNKLEIRRQPLDLATTMADVLEEVRPWFDERGLELKVTEPEAAVPVDGDPDRLQQIQVNLLLNAARYTPQGGQVWYTLHGEESWAVIRVRDTGRGIAAEALEKIFDLFFQTDRPHESPGGGIGVGLTLVRAIVEMHGGRIQAFSDGAGKGSEFVVWLPLTARLERGPAVESSPNAGPMPSCRILLVEDDADIRQSMETLLHMQGHQVTATGSGSAALSELAKSLPDVVLVDIGLPGMDGHELARAIRQRWGGELRLVALTGYGQPRDRERSRAAGFDAHLTKPLRPPELYQLLRSIGDGRAATAEKSGLGD